MCHLCLFNHPLSLSLSAHMHDHSQTCTHCYLLLQEGKVMEGALALEEKERQRKLRELLDQQKRELAERKQQEARDEQTYAEQEQVRMVGPTSQMCLY